MSETVTSELIYKVLKSIRDDVQGLKRHAADHSEQLKIVRHMLVAMQSDDLRHEATMAALRLDLDRIKNRLDLTDA